MKRLIPLLIFIVLIVIFIHGLNRDPHRLPSPLIGHDVPHFKAPDLFQPQKMLTDAMFSGNHPTLLVVFATWCTVCRVEHPKWMDLHQKYHVHFIGLDYKDHRTDAITWLHGFGNPFDAVIFDPKGIIAMDLGVYGTPEMFVVDKEGVIQDKVVGSPSAVEWLRIKKELGLIKRTK